MKRYGHTAASHAAMPPSVSNGMTKMRLCFCNLSPSCKGASAPLPWCTKSKTHQQKKDGLLRLQAVHIKLHTHNLNGIGGKFALRRKHCFHTAAGFKHSITPTRSNTIRSQLHKRRQHRSTTPLDMKIDVAGVTTSTHAGAALCFNSHTYHTMTQHLRSNGAQAMAPSLWPTHVPNSIVPHAIS
jgi:hypothetical protein